MQNASYEQKDPLLVFKLESVKLWDNMIDEMNDRIVSILMRGQIPEVNNVQEAAPEEHSQRYDERKDSIEDELNNEQRKAQQQAMQQDTRSNEKLTSHTWQRSYPDVTTHAHAAAVRSSKTATAKDSFNN